jgi:16S rRNA (guanine527-N7)-methyltransferase
MDSVQQRTALLLSLQQGLDRMSLTVLPAAQSLLVDYVLLLDKWNKAFNLSAIRDPAEMLSRHLLDSLSLIPRIQALLQDHRSRLGKNRLTILDVGTGPGLPGVLLDSNGKKTRFVLQATIELGLSNVQVENRRIENYQSDRQVDIVVSRAFASLADFARGCETVCGPDTRLIAMKGLYPADEIDHLPPNWMLTGAFRLEVPDSDGERHLIELEKQNATG